MQGDLKSVFPNKKHILLDRCEVIGDSVNCFFNVTSSLRIFGSHFAGNPILPGVTQSQMMQNACAVLLKERGYTDIRVIETQNLKFKNPIRPDLNVRIQVQLKAISETHAEFNGTVSDSSGETVYATGKYIFDLNDNCSVPVCEPLRERDVIVDRQTIENYIPHGPDIILCHQINDIQRSARCLEMMAAGQKDRILFPDIVDSIVVSRVHIDKDHYLTDYDRNGNLILPPSNHVEIAAQAGIFMIWEIKPEDKDIETILLSFSGEFLNPIPAGITVENRVHLKQARGNQAKGYMNFFDAELSCGDIVFSRLKYNAVCTYKPLNQ